MKRFHMSYASSFNDDIDFNIAFKRFIVNHEINEDDIFSLIYTGNVSGYIGYDIFVRETNE